MENEKKPVSLHNRPGMEQRIRNTAELLKNFAKENLDEKTAKDIIRGLSTIAEEE